MSCPDYLISELGRRGVGVVQPQSGLDYPFVAPSEDVRYLIADLSVVVDDPGLYDTTLIPVQAPFRIKNLYGIGCFENTQPANFIAPAHEADILVCDVNGRTVFSSVEPDTSFSKTNWGTDYKLYSWKNKLGVCNLLVYQTWAITDASQRHYNKYLEPQNGLLDARAVYVLPKRILSLRVGTLPDAERIKGQVVFKNGYNTEITAGQETTANFFVNTPITFSANAGSGLGRYSTCGDDPEPATQPIKKINGISIENGDFLLAATDCMYVRRPTKKIGGVVSTDDYTDNGVLVRPLDIGANCGACCDCQDYVDLARTINQYRSQYANIGTRVNDVKQIHEQNIQKWIDERSCGLQTPLRLLMVAQRCPYMDIVLMVCNPCADCLYSKELQLELESPTGIGAYAEVVAGYTAMFAANINGRPVPVDSEVVGSKTRLTVQFPVIKNSDSAYVRFRVRFSVKSEYAVTGRLTGKLLDGTAILSGCADDPAQTPRIAAEALATQALYCDVNGETNLP